MASPGRKSKPAQLRLVEGNTGHRPIPEVPHITPWQDDPPDWLTEEAREEFDRKINELKRLGIVNILNAQMFIMYCVTYGEWERQAKAGEIDKAMRVEKEVRMLANEFGLTPTSITKIPTNESGGDDGMEGVLDD